MSARLDPAALAMAEVLLAIDQLWREDHPHGPEHLNPYVRSSPEKMMIWSDLCAALKAAGVPRACDTAIDEHGDDLRDEMIRIVRSQRV